MGDKTHISWADATWNPVTGCSKVSQGCKLCYAMRVAGTRLSHNPRYAGLSVYVNKDMGHQWTREVRCHPDLLDKGPRRWTKPRVVFVNSMGDSFHEAVPLQFVIQLLKTAVDCPQHQMLYLTKRSQRCRQLMAGWPGWVSVLGADVPPANMWIGTSVEDKDCLHRIGDLVDTPVGHGGRWLSLEPLLYDPADKGIDGDDLVPYLSKRGPDGRPLIQWVVVGGESDHLGRARTFDVDRALSIRDVCLAYGVTFHLKQLGNNPTRTDIDVTQYHAFPWEGVWPPATMDGRR